MQVLHIAECDSSTMLRGPEPTKERVELTILSTIAIEITHLTRFALLLLLRILRCMWRNHVATWVQANDSGRTSDLNKIHFGTRKTEVLNSLIINITAKANDTTDILQTFR